MGEAADRLVPRFGPSGEALDMAGSAVLDLLLAHRSVRAFTGEDVAERDLTAMLAAAASAATSSNMQTTSVVVVRDAERRAALGAVPGTAFPLAAAPVALIWCIDWSRNAAVAARAGLADSWTGFLDAVLAGAVDAALAAQNAVAVAESLGLGTCYIGSVRNAPDEVAELLELPPLVFPLLGLAVGHPDPSDHAGVKPRLPLSVTVHREVYRTPAAAELDAYDEVARGYFAGQGIQRGWLDRVRERFQQQAGPRTQVRSALERRGFHLR